MYELHIGNRNYSSWSLRAWVLMRALGIPFIERQHQFAGTVNYQRFRRFSPTGLVPCLIDGAVTVWESLAIAEYVAERHAGVWPAATDARAWARSAAAEIHGGFAMLRNHCGMNCGVRARLHAAPPALQRDFARIDELWCEGLRRWGGPYLAGAGFGAVDAFYAPVAFRVQTYAIPLSAQARAYADHLLQEPAMRSWYADALQEPWRDDDHETELRQYATIVEDLRCASG